jgi:hypothetical protein
MLGLTEEPRSELHFEGVVEMEAAEARSVGFHQWKRGNLNQTTKKRS